MQRRLRLLAIGCALFLAASQSRADLSGLLDKLKGFTGSDTTATQPLTGSPSNAEMIAGLKQALDKGTRYAVDLLGKDGGFLDNARVRIPMPDSLNRVEKALRMLGQDRLADDFVASMNHAAERAVPEAVPVFRDAIQAMTLEDAQQILAGPDDAATQYFRQHTADALAVKMRPIVAAATARVGVTATYKEMVRKAGGFGSLLGDSTDLDGYVTKKTLDGLFLMIADEEHRIRTNPVARTTDLLKKVFGNAGP
jgi:hypothetical protein